MTAPRVPAPSYVLQLAAAYRFLDRFLAAQTFQLEVDPARINDVLDFLEAFLQSCWHVKDWIRNDTNLDQKLRDSVWQDVQASEALLIVADMANGTKHLLRDPRLEWIGADAGSIQMVRNQDGTSTLTPHILLKDGRSIPAPQLARTAMEEWRRILDRNGMMYFRDP